MAVGAKSLKIVRIVISIVAVYVVNIQLDGVFWDKPA